MIYKRNIIQTECSSACSILSAPCWQADIKSPPVIEWWSGGGTFRLFNPIFINREAHKALRGHLETSNHSNDDYLFQSRRGHQKPLTIMTVNCPLLSPCDTWALRARKCLKSLPIKSDWDIRNVSKCIKKDEKYTFNSLILLAVLGLWLVALVWHSSGQEFNSLQLHQIGK